MSRARKISIESRNMSKYITHKILCGNQSTARSILIQELRKTIAEDSNEMNPTNDRPIYEAETHSPTLQVLRARRYRKRESYIEQPAASTAWSNHTIKDTKYWQLILSDTNKTRSTENRWCHGLWERESEYKHAYTMNRSNTRAKRRLLEHTHANTK